MDSTRSETTPQQAHEQLAAAENRVLASADDRRAHALVTAVTGVIVGVIFALSLVVSGVGSVLLYGAVLAVAFGASWWVQRVARTVPRRTKLISAIGVGFSVFVALFAVLPWLNLSAQTSPTTWPMGLAGVTMIAAPTLVAAAVIAGRRG